MGDAVVAVDGYMQREIAGSAYECQKPLEEGQDRIVGVNCFTGENGLEVMTARLVAYPYGVKRRERNERTQVARLKELKRVRDDKEVVRLLKNLRQAATKEEINLMPHFIECVKAYVTLQGMCDVLREVFGEYRAAAL